MMFSVGVVFIDIIGNLVVSICCGGRCFWLLVVGLLVLEVDIVKFLVVWCG